MNFIAKQNGNTTFKRKSVVPGTFFIFLLLGACSPQLDSADVLTTANSVLATALKGTELARPPATLIPSPTTTLSFEDVILPEGSGSLEKVDHQWIFDSPEDVATGKDIQVRLTKLVIDEVERNVLVEPSGFPLFILNQGTAEWEQTGIEYVDVIKPLVDSERNPIPLTYEYLNDERYTISGFFVANGDVLTRDEVNFLPIAASIDGNPKGGLMLTMLTIPIPIGRPTTGSEAYPVVMQYNDSIFVFRGEVLLPTVPADDYFLATIEEGEVFYLNTQVDSYLSDNFEQEIQDAQSSGNVLGLYRLNQMLENRDISLDLFDHLINGGFDLVMLDHLDLWGRKSIGVSAR